MVIRFFCPNGHRIHCSDSQAGRAARCPSCGVKFRIPHPSDEAGQAFDESDSTVAQPQMSDSRLFSTGGGRQAPVREEQIEFLCPNGHRLHGPARLQGRPGQCPECGSRFRIPSYDDVPDEDEQGGDEEIAMGRADGGDASASSLSWGEPPPPSYQQRKGAPLATGGSPASAPPLPAKNAAANLAALFPALWAERQQGAVIEIHLADGESLVPQRFSPERSSEGVGLFAVRQEEDETFTVYAIPWDQVSRVVVRHLGRLPTEWSG